MGEARDWLRRLPGVGPKTAACVLLFSLGKPSLPVDTHIYRVSRRLGLLSPKVSVEKAHDILEGIVPAEDVYRFHVLLIEHGRRLCKAQRSLCSRCPLLFGCPYGTLQAEKQKEV
jgi:endonuclease-3